ncbi:unnamed protein product, partial [Darwinula stevensoni]
MANRSKEEELHVHGKTVARILAEHYDDLDFIDHDAVIACLLRKQVIDHVEHVEIQKKSQKDKILFIQEKLPQKGDTAFQKFLECLEEKGQRDLAGKFRQEIMDSSNGDRKGTIHRSSSASNISCHSSGERRLREDEDPRMLGNGETVATPSAVERMEELQRKLLAAEERANRLEEQLKREQTTHEETKRKHHTIEVELERSRNQIPPCRAKLCSQDDLITYIEKNKDIEEKKILFIHVYSHKSVSAADVANMEKRIAEKTSRTNFLDADLEAAWSTEFFGDESQRGRSDYWIIGLSRTRADLDAIRGRLAKVGKIRNVSSWSELTH